MIAKFNNSILVDSWSHFMVLPLQSVLWKIYCLWRIVYNEFGDDNEEDNDDYDDSYDDD